MIRGEAAISPLVEKPSSRCSRADSSERRQESVAPQCVAAEYRRGDSGHPERGDGFAAGVRLQGEDDRPGSGSAFSAAAAVARNWSKPLPVASISKLCATFAILAEGRNNPCRQRTAVIRISTD